MLRIYGGVLGDIQASSNTAIARAATEYSAVHAAHVASILTAIKESAFRADPLTRALPVWVGHADDAERFIRRQHHALAEAGAGAVAAIDYDMYRMIGLYKGTQVWSAWSRR